MVEEPEPGRGSYKRYRTSRRLRRRESGKADPAALLAELRAAREALTDPAAVSEEAAPARLFRRRRRRPRKWWVRGLRWLAALAAAWIGVSAVIFVISTLVAPNLPASALGALRGGGSPPFSATTILVLGLDGRPPGLKEGGAAQDSETGGPVRSDSMMLIRTGGGSTSRLSIPRDTLVDLPGYGLQKINAAYYYGGASLAVREVDSFLGITIDHVMIVDFTNFEALVNAMGGINYTGGCVYSKIDGGAAAGGWTLKLSAGTHHLDGLQALLLAQTRENLCNPAWTDLTREMNQQALLESMQSQTLSLTGFIHLPWIAWYAPQALVTDMDAPTLAGVATSLALFGSGKTEILYPTGAEYVPGIGDGLTITTAAKRADVQKWLRGPG
jgi:LCP family protein required for cell wall assembly